MNQFTNGPAGSITLRDDVEVGAMLQYQVDGRCQGCHAVWSWQVGRTRTGGRLEVNIGEELLGTFMVIYVHAEYSRQHTYPRANSRECQSNIDLGGATVRRNTNCSSTCSFVNSAASAKEHAPLQADNIGRLRLSAMLHREP